MRPLSVAILLVTAGLAAQRGSKEPAEDPAITAVRTAFKAMWEEFEDGTVDLHGAATDGERADAKRAQVVERLAAVAQNMRGAAAAELLWPAVVFTVDPKLDQGMLFVRCQPWWVRREARIALAAVQPRDELMAWLQPRLKKHTSDPDTSPRLAVIETLGYVGGDDIKALLLPLLRDRDPALRLVLAQALASACAADPEVAQALVPLVESDDDNVKITTIQHLARLARPFLDQTLPPEQRVEVPAAVVDAILGAVGKRLLDDKSWQVRRAATTMLLRARHRKAVPLLINGLKAEARRAKKEGTGALVHSLQDALYQLTGQDIAADAIEQWEKYWAENGAEMMIVSSRDQPKSDRNRDRYLKYFSLDVTSDRVLFIVDRSGSMLEPARLKNDYSNLDPATDKFTIVQTEIEKVVRSLPEDASANILFFSDDVRVWSFGRDKRPRQLPMNDRNKSDLVAFIRLTAPAGATNLYDALDAALNAAGRGLHDKYYGTDFDTIYLLSDGAPTAGAVVDPEQILAHVRETNIRRQVVINTITFGDVNNAEFMGRLAAENGGTHLHIE